MSAMTVLSAAKKLVEGHYPVKEAIIDDVIFRCHYRFTVAFLVISTIVVTTNTWMGDAITCMGDATIPQKTLDSYCWKNTYTLPDDRSKEVAAQASLSGWSYTPQIKRSSTSDGKKKEHQSYYKWVPIMLLFQGVMFYVPHYIWKNWENLKIQTISKGLRGEMDPTMEVAEKQRLRDGLLLHLFAKVGKNNSYAYAYFLCEFLNLAIVIINFVMVDKFIGGSFFTYGISYMKNADDIKTISEIFPLKTRCLFTKYRTSGSIENYSALCLLGANHINQIIYTIMWFWFTIIAIMSIAAVIKSITIIMIPAVRKVFLRSWFSPPSDAGQLIRRIQIGDYLILHFLGRNICDDADYDEFITLFSESFDNGNEGGE